MAWVPAALPRPSDLSNCMSEFISISLASIPPDESYFCFFSRETLLKEP